MIATAEDLEFARLGVNDGHDHTKAVLDAVADVIVTTDESGVIDNVNLAVTKTFGYAADEVVGKRLSMLIPELSSDGRGRPLASGRVECEARRNNGEAVPVELDVTEMRTDGERWFIAVIRDITERKAAEETARRLALTDPLTGLANRNLFNRRFDDALHMARRLDRQVALLLLDLNKFKSINDNFGHPVGDAVLAEVARHLKRSVRDVDTVARLGGDEFAIIVCNVEGMHTVNAIAARIIEHLSMPMTVEGCLVKTGASIGISTFPRDDTDPEALMRLADRALYAAKAAGRGAYRFYDPVIDRASRTQRTLENDMRLALVRGEFVLHYQPQVKMPGGEITGAEALARWRHPARGLISPGEFIPAAESSGLIVDIGEWALRESCRQCKAWQDAGLPPLRVAVNVSPRQFQSDDLMGTVESALGDSGLEAKWLELEITEGTLLADSGRVARRCRYLNDLGVQLAIDDFGTGYSSLAYLTRLPVQRLKIDQTFVQNLTADPDDAAIAMAVIQLGRSLHLNVIAEGVETDDQAEFLVTSGCAEAQGFLISRPLPADDFAQWVRSRPHLAAA